MTQEDYVSFEVAKLLKEKGFDGPCLSYFWSEGIDTSYTDIPFTQNNMYEGQILRPTLQMAIKWLREVYDIDINIYAESISHKKRYTVSIWKNIQEDDAINDVIMGVSTIYEEACEAAIKYCLENLI